MNAARWALWFLTAVLLVSMFAGGGLLAFELAVVTGLGALICGGIHSARVRKAELERGGERP